MLLLLNLLKYEILLIRKKHATIQVAQYLIRKGANVNAVDEEGLAPLHMALEDGHDAVVQLLLAAGN